MEYFREVINSTKGRKGKIKPPLGGVYKEVEVEAFQCHRSEFNQHPVAEVMLVLLNGGRSTPSSSADGRAGSTTRPSAKLDRPHDQLGCSTGWTGPIRQMDELD
ncbi:hypothetical protein F2Q68_00030870 [Brassica cretica]|uniref:Uncharacterized protein n=1 Tax=Brassica cretica TaxID=69181 RepID=A0A8S9GAE4_BRACR|nr:hypothetical protein F2Q68_00030870 [Brassica cretica]